VALTWTLWLLAKDQATQQRVFDEVTDIAGAGSITAAHVDRLIFCRQVISEAMRLFPPAPGIGRQPNDAMTLAGMQISVRTRVHIPIFALHRNVRLWDNPTAFDPDRFTANKVKARSRYAFLPFGSGPRVCIGASFATIEAAVILAVLVRTFSFPARRRTSPETSGEDHSPSQGWHAATYCQAGPHIPTGSDATQPLILR
jgi:cytochrome P450